MQSDYPGMNLVVSPKIESVGKKIKLSDLLAEYGINNQLKSDETTNSILPNNEGNSFSFNHN